MLLTLALHALAAAVAPALVARLGRRVFVVCALALAATVAWAVSRSGLVATGGSVAERLPWVAALDVAVAVRVDGLSLLMLTIVEGIGVLVPLYSATYFRDQPRLGGAAGALTVFAGAMAGLVVADNLFLLFVFWELTSISSYILIGFDHHERRAREAAQHALLITAGGGLAMLAGFVLVGQAAGTYTLSSILATPPTAPRWVPGWVSSWSARSRNPLRFLSMAGCQMRWRHQPRSVPICMQRAWSRLGSTSSPASLPHSPGSMASGAQWWWGSASSACCTGRRVLCASTTSSSCSLTGR